MTDGWHWMDSTQQYECWVDGSVRHSITKQSLDEQARTGHYGRLLAQELLNAEPKEPTTHA